MSALPQPPTLCVRRKPSQAVARRDCLAAVLERRLLVLSASLNTVGFSPFVIVVMGTNGGGKTTTIAKLCRYFARQRKSVLLAAGDTFRAAAREQLREWAIKLGGVEMVDFSGAPAAVAYDAAVAGAKRGTDIVLVDTAGRLPSQPNLMAELAKIRRATAKAIPADRTNYCWFWMPRWGKTRWCNWRRFLKPLA